MAGRIQGVRSIVVPACQTVYGETIPHEPVVVGSQIHQPAPFGCGPLGSDTKGIPCIPTGLVGCAPPPKLRRRPPCRARHSRNATPNSQSRPNLARSRSGAKAVRDNQPIHRAIGARRTDHHSKGLIHHGNRHHQNADPRQGLRFHFDRRLQQRAVLPQLLSAERRFRLAASRPGSLIRARARSARSQPLPRQECAPDRRGVTNDRRGGAGASPPVYRSHSSRSWPSAHRALHCPNAQARCIVSYDDENESSSKASPG
jgi:hypothetical protein